MIKKTKVLIVATICFSFSALSSCTPEALANLITAAAISKASRSNSSGTTSSSSTSSTSSSSSVKPTTASTCSTSTGSPNLSSNCPSNIIKKATTQDALLPSNESNDF